MRKNKMDLVKPVKPTKEERRRGPQTRWPSAGETVVLWPVEPQVLWYRTHYINDRTRPCLGNLCGCNKQEQPVNTRLVGWILAYEPKARDYVLAQVTKNCLKNCPALSDESLDLRTCELTLTRIGRKVNGKVVATVRRDAHQVGKVALLPYTQRDQLMRVWFKETDAYEEVNQVAEVLDRLGQLGLAAQEDETADEQGGEA